MSRPHPSRRQHRRRLREAAAEEEQRQDFLRKHPDAILLAENDPRAQAIRRNDRAVNRELRRQEERELADEARWAGINTWDEAIALNMSYIRGETVSTPYHGGPFSQHPDTQSLSPELLAMHERGLMTVNGQGPEYEIKPEADGSGQYTEMYQRVYLVFCVPAWVLAGTDFVDRLLADPDLVTAVVDPARNVQATSVTFVGDRWPVTAWRTGTREQLEHKEVRWTEFTGIHRPRRGRDGRWHADTYLIMTRRVRPCPAFVTEMPVEFDVAYSGDWRNAFNVGARIVQHAVDAGLQRRFGLGLLERVTRAGSRLVLGLQGS